MPGVGQLDDGVESLVTVTDNEKIRLTPNRSFGAGVHRCLGKSLARMELSVVGTEWLRAIPDFVLEPGYTPGFTFTQGGAIMPRSLPLRWGKGEPPARTRSTAKHVATAFDTAAQSTADWLRTIPTLKVVVSAGNSLRPRWQIQDSNLGRR